MPYDAVVDTLTDGSWLGPAAASMAASSQAQVQWLTGTGVQAELVAVPVVGGNGGRGMQFAPPRYGFKPTVVPRPPVGG